MASSEEMNCPQPYLRHQGGLFRINRSATTKKASLRMRLVTVGSAYRGKGVYLDTDAPNNCGGVQGSGVWRQ